MTRIANRFTDPKTAKTYDWPINNDEEGGFEKRRNISHGANTGQTGLVKKQGDESPLVWKLTGKILTEAMITEMWKWWELCKAQTMNFRDFTGDEYEVLVTYFNPIRHRAIKNPRDLANAPLHYWTYELEMEIIRVISGPLVGVSP